MNRFAFIGLGNMGSGMAANLAKTGLNVTAFDVAAAALDHARASGCSVAQSAMAAVADADVVITMLPTGAHVRQIYSDSILSHAPRGALLIDSSTIDVDSARDIASQAREGGYRAADAPVSGGTAAANAGTLTFMVGCDTVNLSAVKAALDPMAKAVIHAGAAGAGQAAKACNNMLLGISMIGTCEAFALAERLGLEAERFFEIASQSSGQCWSLTSYCPLASVGPDTPADHGYVGGFATALMLKDLTLAQEAAAMSGATTPLGAQAKALYAVFESLGHGRKDFSAILHMLRGELAELS